jgi:hypothetical protein
MCNQERIVHGITSQRIWRFELRVSWQLYRELRSPIEKFLNGRLQQLGSLRGFAGQLKLAAIKTKNMGQSPGPILRNVPFLAATTFESEATRPIRQKRLCGKQHTTHYLRVHQKTSGL